MYARYIKRLIDIIVSIIAMPFLGILILIVGPMIVHEDKGPIFYNAPRVGKDGRIFTMYKFRSMKVNSPDLVMEDGSTYNGLEDPRITRVGEFIRKTSIDEFPQFINVLKGDMSVIGPRPNLIREAELYRGNESDKLMVRPGITGYAAVCGRNSIPWHDRLALDVYYVHNLSFALDIKIFVKTFTTIFSHEDVYAADETLEVASEVAPSIAEAGTNLTDRKTNAAGQGSGEAGQATAETAAEANQATTAETKTNNSPQR